MSILVTGASGRLGSAFCRQVPSSGQVVALSRSRQVEMAGLTTEQLDLCDRTAVLALISRHKPRLVIHCAALTNVDQCETDPDLAQRVNVDVTRNVAWAARTDGASLVHISTDQLWDGSKPFMEVFEEPCPVNVYGRTKALAETVVREVCPDALIVRTNFFGQGTSTNKTLSDWVLGELEQGKPVRMFRDVYFNPISINRCVQMVLALAHRKVTGTVHIGSRNRVSKFEFGCLLAEAYGYPTRMIVEGALADVPLRARRPLDMSLSVARTELVLGEALPTVDQCIQGLGKRAAV